MSAKRACPLSLVRKESLSFVTCPLVITGQMTKDKRIPTQGQMTIINHQLLIISYQLIFYFWSCQILAVPEAQPLTNFWPSGL